MLKANLIGLIPNLKFVLGLGQDCTLISGYGWDIGLGLGLAQKLDLDLDGLSLGLILGLNLGVWITRTFHMQNDNKP